MSNKFFVVTIALAMAAVMLAYPPRQTQSIQVPIIVQKGDTLWGICKDLGDRYGDRRSYSEITFYAAQQNPKAKGFIEPGDKLVIELMVDKVAEANTDD